MVSLIPKLKFFNRLSLKIIAGNSTASLTDNFTAATAAIFKNWRVCSLGIIQALFEGSMYAFVLMWTPALSVEGKR